MKVLVITSNVPWSHDGASGVTAVHLQVYELIQELIGLGHEILLQIIFNESHSCKLTDSEKEEIANFEGTRFLLLPPITQDEYVSALPQAKLQQAIKLVFDVKRFFRSLYSGKNLSEFYPSVRLQHKLSALIREYQVDGVLTLISPEGNGAIYKIEDVPKVAFHGDIDFIPFKVRSDDAALFDLEGNRHPFLLKYSQWRFELWLKEFERAHQEIMLHLDVIANATAINGEYYIQKGHPRSFFIGTIWKDLKDDFKININKYSFPIKKEKVKIIGHVGGLGQTASTYGLRFLLRDVMPMLEKRMEGIDYEVHIIGGGKPVSSLRPYLEHPKVVVRGFVEDLDSELNSSDIFLFLNNAGPLIAIFSRQIIAWSMGLCLVTHRNSIKALPNLVHGENALMGETPEEVAEAVYSAASNLDLNRKIRKAGRKTFENHFAPSVVAKKLSDELEKML